MDNRIVLIENHLADLENQIEYFKRLKNRIANGEVVGESDEDLVENTLFEGTYDLKHNREFYFASKKKSTDFFYEPIVKLEFKETFETKHLRVEFDGRLNSGAFKIYSTQLGKEFTGSYKFHYFELTINLNILNNLSITYSGVDEKNLAFIFRKIESLFLEQFST